MPAPNGSHLNDLSPEQFHPVILRENAGLGYPVVLRDSERPSEQLDCHGPHHIPLPSCAPPSTRNSVALSPSLSSKNAKQDGKCPSSISTPPRWSSVTEPSLAR